MPMYWDSPRGELPKLCVRHGKDNPRSLSSRVCIVSSRVVTESRGSKNPLQTVSYRDIRLCASFERADGYREVDKSHRPRSIFPGKGERCPRSSRCECETVSAARRWGADIPAVCLRHLERTKEQRSVTPLYRTPMGGRGPRLLWLLFADGSESS